MKKSNVIIFITITLSVVIFCFGIFVHKYELFYKEPSIDAIACTNGEVMNYNVTLQITVDGKNEIIPRNIGHHPFKCNYWLYTSSTPNLIHISSPVRRPFILDDFFRIWGGTVSKTQILNYKGTVKAWVNGKPISYDPAYIPLTKNEKIVLKMT